MSERRHRRRPIHTDRLPGQALVHLATVLTAKRRDPQAEFGLDNSQLCQVVWPEESKRGFKALSRARRRYLACWYLEAETENGGLQQFMDNRGQAVIREALAFLKERGYRRFESLLRRAIGALPGGKLPRTHRRLQDLLLADFREDGDLGPIGRKLDRLTSAFYRLNEGRRLTRARLEYVRDHADDFYSLA